MRVAWQAGLLATFATGVIELGCAFLAERVRKATPRAALLSTLAGIAPKRSVQQAALESAGGSLIVLGLVIIGAGLPLFG